MRVAIMGFGRMGRNIFRSLYARNDVEVVAINDIAPPEAIEYLLKYDSLYGKFPEPVHVMNGFLYAKGRRIPVLHKRDPGEVPWYDFGAEIVVEATGKFRHRVQLQKHLDAGAHRVILTTPPRDEIDAVFVKGVSAPLRREHRIVSCGSSTANAVAPMLKVLDDAFGVESGFFTSVHAYTGEQSLVDVPNPNDLRLSRAAVENIVPVTTWTTHAIEMLFPKLKGKFGGSKLNVPVPDVSCVNLITIHARELRPEDVNEVFRSAARSVMQGVVEFTEDPIVSTDLRHSRASCIFDSQSTMISRGKLVKTLGFYEQGGGLAARIVDLIAQLSGREE